MLKVLHRCIGTGEEQSLVPVVAPAHPEGRLALLPAHLKDLRVPFGLTQMMSVYHKSISGSPMPRCASRNRPSWGSGEAGCLAEQKVRKTLP